MRVYVAGKLNATNAVDYIKNVHTMMEHAENIRRSGHAVFIPCLDLLCGLMCGDYEYKDYVENNMQWLERADAVFVCPNSEESHGTRAEVQRAKDLGILVIHDMEELV